MMLLALLLVCLSLSLPRIFSISDVTIEFSASDIREQTNITIKWTNEYRAIYQNETIVINLPQFTRRADYNSSRLYNSSYNLEYGELMLSPSIYFTGKWEEGRLGWSDYTGDYTYANYNNTPYADAKIYLRALETFPKDQDVTIVIYKHNGIRAYCGFPSSAAIATYGDYQYVDRVPFQVMSNWSADTVTDENVTVSVTSWGGIGAGCTSLNNCNGHGRCNFCGEVCECVDGYGSINDTVLIGRALTGTCADKVCPSGKAIGDIATSSTTAHALSECSNAGVCDRSKGECVCFPPFTGAACERRSCPNDCSGHGACLSMATLATMQGLSSPSYAYEYGTAAGMDSYAWDYNVMYGCHCDSSWSYGFEEDQVQVSEWFGPDCSLRHCPSGDNPYTTENELRCQGKNQMNKNDEIKGKAGNICHVDCSNRGICDYTTGKCTCFEGSWGDDCGQVSFAGTHPSNNYNYSKVTVGN